MQTPAYRSNELKVSDATGHALTVHERTTSEELIPLSELFGNPENTSPVLSPDGKYLAYLAPSDQNVMNIYVRDLESAGKSDSSSGGWDKSQDRLITNEPKRGIRSVAWAYDNTTIFYMQDNDGNEDFHLYAVDLTQPSGAYMTIVNYVYFPCLSL